MVGSRTSAVSATMHPTHDGLPGLAATFVVYPEQISVEDNEVSVMFSMRICHQNKTEAEQQSAYAKLKVCSEMLTDVFVGSHQSDPDMFHRLVKK